MLRLWLSEPNKMLGHAEGWSWKGMGLSRLGRDGGGGEGAGVAIESETVGAQAAHWQAELVKRNVVHSGQFQAPDEIIVTLHLI